MELTLKQRRLTALAGELGVPAPALRLHIVERDRVAIEDLREAEDRTGLADLLLAILRELTSDPACATHVSLAGGRKTMSFFAGYVLSLLARPQDRLSHVLVAPPLESHPEFFWPCCESRLLLPVGGGPAFNSAEAEVALVEAPFVRLRDELPAGLLAAPQRFAEAVAAAQTALGTPSLTIELPSRCARAGGLRLRLRPVQLPFLLLLLARRRVTGDGAVSWRDLTSIEVLEAYADLYGFDVSGYERLRQVLAGGVDAAWFQERKSRHDKIVADTLGRSAAPYQLGPTGRRSQTRWRLRLPPDRIRISRESLAA